MERVSLISSFPLKTCPMVSASAFINSLSLSSGFSIQVIIKEEGFYCQVLDENVIPAQAGIQTSACVLDSRLCGNDGLLEALPDKNYHKFFYNTPYLSSKLSI